MLNDVTMGALQSALDGLSARQQAISDDIANVNTPFYRSRSVEFESSLRRAIENGESPLSATPTVVYSTAAPGLNGNNVDLASATVASAKTEMSYELALRAVSDRVSITRSAIRGA